MVPIFPTSTFRGGFGVAFKRIACIQRNTSNCHRCVLLKTCPYAYIFETTIPDNSTKLRNIKDIPRPYVIENPFFSKKYIVPDEEIYLDVILLGKAINYLPYFILAIQELGRMGLGKDRGKFILEKVKVYKNDNEYDTVYTLESEAISNQQNIIDLNYLATKIKLSNVNEVTIMFQTPTKIRLNNQNISCPDFNHLFRALIHRLSAISYFHCEKEPILDFVQLIEDSRSVERHFSQVNWIEYSRFSTRQKSDLLMGGFIGEVSYKGMLNQFLPFILLGEAVHVGKNCTFGFGKYQLLTINRKQKNEEGVYE
ncbi:hypothetical protein HKBW3C_02172 [Candidatus Hakubella thermalkaliphila]|uniref:CRISPR-associated protein Cas6 C-terminal domain-containing protein n=2 Tax=Candidatus Hakubella thermalkaliphila TaxID=2754717 RepID=A0A6V8P6F8_9ACTN|nr:hypothetical protein HKBW3S33_01395 [Candidatus Hakubella thermalkaliphila]GFP43040.1 hypothetical protein HKBW3C_02172 [Candidatus Hakubella thermalkaliphila]